MKKFHAAEKKQHVTDKQVRELIDTSSTIRARYDYDLYGRVNKVSGDKDASFTFTGHYAHAISGILLTRYRAYDQNLGGG